ncbi:EamA family transporter RarD [Ectothiorhodospiraceae bacterium BW-2]|nr:EamA family transporter RarD [Ectothiorhodospiraceae bacterium BW-2]
MKGLNSRYIGSIYGIGAYLLWGFFPLFFHFLAAVPAPDVLMHRILWSFAVVVALTLLLKRQQQVRTALNSTAVRRRLLLSSLLISVNWLVFIWAVSQARVVESSLGYFITPLVSVFLGRFILHEVLNGWQKGAILMAITGLIWLIVHEGVLPWISLLLALTFGGYGLVRKQVAVDSLTGFSVEILLLFPFALGYGVVMLLFFDHTAFMVAQPLTNLLLLLSGVVTATPLLLFAAAAKRLPLSVVGFMMYINPTMQFITAVVVFNEPFEQRQLIGFCFIWAALVVFTLGSFSSAASTR